jgi:hypothetical protein
MPSVVAHFVKAQVKHFNYDDKDKALEWLAAPLGGHHPMPGEDDRVTDPNWDSGKMERCVIP